jgi:hypothetical protein
LPQGFEPVELLDGAAVVAFGLGLVADGQGPTVGLFDHAVESFAEHVVAVLGAGDLEIAGEFLRHEEEGVAGGVEDLGEAGGEQAGLEARGAEEGLLGEGDALDGEELLGVDGLVDGEEVGSEMVDFLEVLEPDDAEGGGGETVFAAILRGDGLTLRGAGSGGLGGVGAIGGELFGGDGFTGTWHAIDLPI